MVLSSPYSTSHINHYSSTEYGDALMIVDEKLRHIREQDGVRHDALVTAIGSLTNQLNNLLKPPPDPDPPPLNLSTPQPPPPVFQQPYCSPPQQPPSSYSPSYSPSQHPPQTDSPFWQPPKPPYCSPLGSYYPPKIHSPPSAHQPQPPQNQPLHLYSPHSQNCYTSPQPHSPYSHPFSPPNTLYQLSPQPCYPPKPSQPYYTFCYSYLQPSSTIPTSYQQKQLHPKKKEKKDGGITKIISPPPSVDEATSATTIPTLPSTIAAQSNDVSCTATVNGSSATTLSLFATKAPSMSSTAPPPEIAADSDWDAKNGAWPCAAMAFGVSVVVKVFSASS